MNYDAALSALDEQQARVTSALAGATADRNRLALQVATAPDNKSLTADLSAIEDEITGYERDLKRLDGARRALAAQQVEDTHDARKGRLDAARKRAIDATGKRLAAVKQIEKAVASLGEALVAEAASGTEAWAAVLDAASIASGNADASSVAALAGTLHGQASGTGCAPGVISMLNAALRRSASAGSKVPHLIALSGFLDPAPLPAATAQADLERLTSTLNMWSAA